MLEDFYIIADAAESEIKKWYKKRAEIAGFDLSEEVCEDYEDNKIPFKHWKKLIEGAKSLREFWK